MALNNVAQLLQATDRLAEAEPLSRRTVEIFLQFTRETGHPHPHLQIAFQNHARLLEIMGRSADDIRRAFETLGQRFGFDMAGAGAKTDVDPSSELVAAIEQLIRDPSKTPELGAKLQREDLALLMAFMQAIKCENRAGGLTL